MAVKDIVTAVLATPGVKLGGKTPAATIAAILYKGVEFQKTGRGMFALAPAARTRRRQKRSTSSANEAATRREKEVNA